MSSTVRYLMTTPVVTVRRETPFKDIVIRLRAAHVGAVPVTDDCGLVMGMVSEGDLLARKAGPERGTILLARLRRRREPGEAASVTAATLMTTPAVTTRPGATSGEVARLMHRHRISSLPVVDRAGRLIGIVSRGAVLDAFTRPDLEIRREVVRDVISRDFLLDPDTFTVTVRNGIVTLSGHPETDQVGRSLAAAVRGVEGVVAVHDQLSYSAGRAPGPLRQ